MVSLLLDVLKCGRPNTLVLHINPSVTILFWTALLSLIYQFITEAFASLFVLFVMTFIKIQSLFSFVES
jgi:hypothetical protein